MNKINELCIKCGNNHANIEYFGGNVRVVNTETLGGTVTISVNVTNTEAEILVLTCDKCGFEWVENVVTPYKE